MAGSGPAHAVREDTDGEQAKPARSRRPELSLVGAGTDGDAAERPRILLVEDDAAMAFICGFNLELSGFDVTTATSGAEGLQLAADGSYDLVLLDVMLPDVGGLEVAEQLGGTPIVFLSARGSQDDVERGRAAGAIDYVVKPFDPVELPARLRDDLAELRTSGPDGVWQRRFGRAR